MSVVSWKGEPLYLSQLIYVFCFRVSACAAPPLDECSVNRKNKGNYTPQRTHVDTPQPGDNLSNGPFSFLV
jgi:hypothetical protein